MSKKKAYPTPQVPRPMEEIEREYIDLRSKAGELQYKAFVLDKELSGVNARLYQVVDEHTQRQTLAKEMAAQQTAAQPAPAQPPVETSQQ